MLPPTPMLAKKNRICGAILFLTLAIFISGCTPPGPRALLEGKKCLDRGDYAEAVAQFRTATTLLPANAQAWNYLGVACQRAGQPADAVAAYTRALALDRDLMEAHYNLGCLWLEQNKTDAAMTEFTACTLRRPNDPQGWLKLGSAQLHLSLIHISRCLTGAFCARVVRWKNFRKACSKCGCDFPARRRRCRKFPACCRPSARKMNCA